MFKKTHYETNASVEHIILVMRKLLLLSVMTIGMIASGTAQMAIPGAIFTSNQARFNGRKVTIKNVQVLPETTTNSNVAVAPINPNPVSINPGNIGPIGQVSLNCRAPRGFSTVNILFLEEPDFQGCFFVEGVMYKELMRSLGGQATDAQITFRGDSRIGYHITMFKLQ